MRDNYGNKCYNGFSKWRINKKQTAEERKIIMKKIVSALLVCVLLVGCMLSLASCGKTLNGTYKGTGLLSGTSYAFDGNKVTITVEVPILEDIVLEGTYEITKNDKDEEVIIFSFGEDTEDSEKYSGEYSYSEGNEGDTKFIKIGGVQYNKVEK